MSAILSSFSYYRFSFSVCCIYNVAIISLLLVGILVNLFLVLFFKRIFVLLPFFAQLVLVLQFLLSLVTKPAGRGAGLAEKYGPRTTLV